MKNTQNYGMLFEVSVKSGFESSETCAIRNLQMAADFSLPVFSVLWDLKKFP